MARLVLALRWALLAGPAMAVERPDARPPDAAKTDKPSTSVGETGKTPNTVYPDAPAATPSTEGANDARPPDAGREAGAVIMPRAASGIRCTGAWWRRGKYAVMARRVPFS